MKNNRSLLLTLGLVFLSYLMVACGVAKETTSPTQQATSLAKEAAAPTPEVASPTKEATFPAGKFLKSGAPTHIIVFQKDGIFVVMEGSTTLVTGTYHADGNTYTEESNNAGCNVPLSFKYTFDGENLTFNYVGDPAKDTCSGGGRRADFDNVTYRLSK
jgi:hypothetical protein